MNDPDRSRPASSATVMIVEDYAPLRTLCTRVLRRAGYTSIALPSADDALSTLTDRTAPSVVVTDLNMPGQVTGEDFIARVRADHPEIGVIVITGETEDIPDDVGDLVLTKPFANEALVDAVADLLGDRG